MVLGGGSRNLVIDDFPVALWFVAYLDAMRPHGMKPEDVGRMIYDLFETDLEQMPEAERRAEGAKLFTPGHVRKLEDRWTRKREYHARKAR